MAYKLVFDTTSADTQNASANVGAYLRGGNDGGLVSQTGNALHVSVQNASLVVTATDLDIRDLTAASDSVAAWAHDGSGNAIGSTAGSLDVNLTNASVVVSATDLDIRDLTAASDSVQAWAHDGSGTAISSTLNSGKQSLDVNITGAEVSLDVEDDVANIAIASAQEDVTTTSAKLITSDLTDRRFIWLYNDGNRNTWIGPSGVTSSTGFLLPPGALLPARIGAAVAIHAVTDSGTQSVHVLQAS